MLLLCARCRLKIRNDSRPQKRLRERPASVLGTEAPAGHATPVQAVDCMRVQAVVSTPGRAVVFTQARVAVFTRAQAAGCTPVQAVVSMRGQEVVFAQVRAADSMVVRRAMIGMPIRAHGDRVSPARRRANGFEQIVQIVDRLDARSSPCASSYPAPILPSTSLMTGGHRNRSSNAARAAGKFGAVHFQFPPWFTYRSDSFHHIKECVAKLQGGTSEAWAKAEQGYLMATEFRHGSWFEGKHLDGTLRFESERRLVHVVVDSPQGPRNSVPAVWEVTDPDLVIVRLHGRNQETWNMKGLESSADRFNYDYRDDELAEIAEKIHSLSRNVAKVHVLFNNNNGDQAQRNAKTLTTMIRRWQDKCVIGGAAPFAFRLP